MSSVIFQPLLHDPLGWKATNTTYADTFKWKKYRSTSKDKIISTYGQQYQKQLQKHQKSRQSNSRLPSATNEEQPIPQVIIVKKNEENRGPTSSSHRYSPSKTPPVVVEEPPALVVEYKQRSASTNREATSSSRASKRPSTVLVTTEETCRPATSLEARRSLKEEKEKVIVDANNDNSRHWLTYPNPKTPQYLIDVKQRLGQLKIPSTLARPASGSNVSAEQHQTPQPSEHPDSSASHRQQQKQQSDEQRHLFDFNLPDTPVELRAARNRIEKHRYNPSLDNYPSRPHTCSINTNDISKPLTPPNLPESEDEQLPPIHTAQIKDDAWIVDEENKTTENETPAIMVQMIDVDGMPNEYVEALEIANLAQEEYLKNLKLNGEKRPDNPVYRLPSLSPEFKTDSFIAFRNQQQSTPPPTTNSTRRNDFGSWVRNATDRERESAMKILHDVLNQPVMGYDIPRKQHTVFKQAPAPPPVRTNSATRKLGRTRTHQRIPCEICEKQMIKRHVWDLSRSDTLTCGHQAHGLKPPIIQVRA